MYLHMHCSFAIPSAADWVFDQHARGRGSRPTTVTFILYLYLFKPVMYTLSLHISAGVNPCISHRVKQSYLFVGLVINLKTNLKTKVNHNSLVLNLTTVVCFTFDAFYIYSYYSVIILAKY